jgi:hypothetical protein
VCVEFFSKNYAPLGSKKSRGRFEDGGQNGVRNRVSEVLAMREWQRSSSAQMRDASGTMVFVVCQMTADRVSRNDIFTFETDNTVNACYVRQITITELGCRHMIVIF